MKESNKKKRQKQKQRRRWWQLTFFSLRLQSESLTREKDVTISWYSASVKSHTTFAYSLIYLRLARMEVSCKSPGSNSWAPFRPSSSQPRRKTDRLSWRKQQQLVNSSLEQGGLQRWVSHWGQCPLTSPAMGVGSLLIFLTSPGLIALSSLQRGEGGAEIYEVL